MRNKRPTTEKTLAGLAKVRALREGIIKLSNETDAVGSLSFFSPKGM